MKGRGGDIVLAAVLALVGYRLLAAPAACANDIRIGIAACTQQIIPSLFAFMILAELLVRTGTYRLIGRPFRGLARCVFRLSEGEFSIFLVSQLAGYPVGCTMLAAAVQSGDLPPARARRLVLFCFAGGPAFLINLVGIPVYGSTTAGWLIYAASVGANLVLALLLRKREPAPELSARPQPWQTALVAGTRSAAKNLFGICAMVLMTDALLGVLRPLRPAWLATQIGVPKAFADGATAAIFEVSHIADFPFGRCDALPLLAGLSAFGGLCVALQLFALGGTWFPAARFVLVRGIAGVLAGLICYAAAPAVMADYTAQTWTGTVRAATSDVPFVSVLLLLMGAMVLYQAEGIARQRKTAANQS